MVIVMVGSEYVSIMMLADPDKESILTTFSAFETKVCPLESAWVLLGL